jgi:hypothetical protein
MLRESRIDVPAALHHIIGIGIDRRKIFLDDEDRDQILERLAANLKRTKTSWYGGCRCQSVFFPFENVNRLDLL